ncbi:MAG: tetratricopeptide repeat protein [Spirochaetota bacterium]|nr:MAG: tetratricopeptide repeat protein [Spirochaetota bacterium]
MKIVKRIIVCLWIAASFFMGMAAFADPYSRLINKGNRYYRNELYSEALKHYIEGKAKNQKALEPVFNIGSAYYKKEEYNSSVDSFEAALELTKKKNKQADIYYNLGTSYLQSGDYEKAIESYIKGLELFPADLNMKYNLELALKRLKEQQKIEDEKKSGASGDGASEKGVRTSDKKSEEGSGEPKEDLKTEESAGRGEEEQTELSREEAERLLRSVNKEQIEILNNIIEKRTSGVQTDKDW